MVQILPFCGWRYDLSQVGSLSEVTAPSLNLIDETVQRTLYRQHPCNAIRLVMNREEPGDSSPADRSARADDFFRLWKREGILLREHATAFYIVETKFPWAGAVRVRWSVIARLRLPERFPDSVDGLSSVVPSNPADVCRRADLLRVCHASLSPVTALLADTTGEDSDPRSLSDHLESMVRLLPPIESIDDNGIRHRMWPLTNESAKTELTSRLSRLSVCVVDGASEISAASQVRDEMIAAGSLSDPNSPAHTILTCLIADDDRGLEFLPRLLTVSTTQMLTGRQLQQKLSAELLCQFVGSDVSASDDAAELARLSNQQPCVAIGTADETWMIVSPGTTVGINSFTPLVERIVALLTADSADCEMAIIQPLPLNFQSVCHSAGIIRQQNPDQLLIVEPPRTASDIVSCGERSEQLPEHAARLYPCIPAGLVFSSWES